jgi:hypothetical protein
MSVDEGAELSEHLTAPYLYGTDLCDAIVDRRSSSGLDVQNAEGHVGEFALFLGQAQLHTATLFELTFVVRVFVANLASAFSVRL